MFTFEEILNPTSDVCNRIKNTSTKVLLDSLYEFWNYCPTTDLNTRPGTTDFDNFTVFITACPMVIQVGFWSKRDDNSSYWSEVSNALPVSAILWANRWEEVRQPTYKGDLVTTLDDISKVFTVVKDKDPDYIYDDFSAECEIEDKDGNISKASLARVILLSPTQIAKYRMGKEII